MIPKLNAKSPSPDGKGTFNTNNYSTSLTFSYSAKIAV